MGKPKRNGLDCMEPITIDFDPYKDLHSIGDPFLTGAC
jgi:hypothetical protein